jgi:hypothetical protein
VPGGCRQRLSAGLGTGRHQCSGPGQGPVASDDLRGHRGDRQGRCGQGGCRAVADPQNGWRGRGRKVEHDSTRLGDLEALVDGCVLLTDSPRLTFSGIGVYRPALFDECNSGRFPLAAVIRKAASWGLVTGEHYRGVWIDVGTLARLSQLDASLQGV